MGIFYAGLIFLGPRLAFLLYWLVNPQFVHQVLNGWLWPLLGAIFLPWTAATYVMAHTAYDQSFGGSDWLWLGAALAVDVATYAGGVYYRVKREKALSPMEWIERSHAVRIFVYLVMLIIGFAPAIFFVFALMGGITFDAGFWVEYLTYIFLAYLVLGFLFCFVDPTKPWLPGLLLSAPAVLVICYLASGPTSLALLAGYVAASASAATLGAYLGALLLKRKRTR